MITDHRFVGKREWGINPPDSARCQVDGCGMPKSQHQVICPNVLIIKGESFGCEMVPPHDGWPHSNAKAEAVWGPSTSPAYIAAVHDRCVTGE